MAYITDSCEGAIIVVDLGTGVSRRLLERHHSGKAERVVLTIEGREWRPNGEAPRVHSDGLALSPDTDWLYYQALTGRTLYGIRTEDLRNPALTRDQLAAKVKRVCQTGAADGIEFGKDGFLYLTAIERNALTRVDVNADPIQVETVAIRDDFDWPDSIACHEDGSLYVTTSRIHFASPHAPPPGPFRLFRLQPVTVVDRSQNQPARAPAEVEAFPTRRII